jgi:23S rRNA (cytidine1920-2'-O)/16S rRNA (cytidine1409-2'-O)-methyltransferase
MTRLDLELVNRNVFETRNKSQNEIKRGLVYVNNNKTTKPSFDVSENDKIEIKGEILKYVSRGGLKLEHAIKEFNLNLKDKIMLDIGSSTGGFSDCAIQYGIGKIYAIDVGSNQFSEKLKNNKKIHLYENTDFRNIDENIIKDAKICTIDVSFISVTKLVEKISKLNIEEIICLIKPQFECGIDIANKYKGVPLDKNVHNEVIINVINSFKSINYYLNNITYSPIRGGNGNIEYLAYFTKEKKDNIDFNSLIKQTFKNFNL